MIEVPTILPKNEITELILDYQNTKNLDSRDRVIMNNIKLVYTIAHKYGQQKQSNGYTFDDFVSEGVVGLMKAIDKFDVSKKSSFTTYAYWWIKKSMSKTLTIGTLNIPQHRIELLHRYEKCAKKYTDAGLPPNIRTIAKELKVSGKILFDTVAQGMYTSVDDNNFSYQHQSHNGINKEEEKIFDKMDFDKIWSKAKRELKPQEIQVLEDRLGFNGKKRTLKEISTEMGVSNEWIRKLYDISLNKVKVIAKRRSWQ